MKDLLDDLINKWVDVRNCADDWEERNLAQEVIEDLREVTKWVKH